MNDIYDNEEDDIKLKDALSKLSCHLLTMNSLLVRAFWLGKGDGWLFSIMQFCLLRELEGCKCEKMWLVYA